MSAHGDTPSSSDPGASAEFDREHGIDRHVADPALHEPVMIVMLTGWIDATGAAAAAVVLAAAAGLAAVSHAARWRPTAIMHDGAVVIANRIAIGFTT